MPLQSPSKTGLLWLVTLACAGAHPDQQNAMWMQFEPSKIHMAVDVSLKELSTVWGIPQESMSEEAQSTLRWAAEKHQSYLLEHLSISADTESLLGRVIKITSPTKFGDPEETFVQYELDYTLLRAPAREVRVYHDMLKEWPYAPGTPWNIRYVLRTKRSGSEEVHSWLLSAGQPAVLNTGWEDETLKTVKDASAPSAPSFLRKAWRAMQLFFGS